MSILKSDIIAGVTISLSILTAAGLAFLPNITNFLEPAPSPVSAHAADENLSEEEQWWINLETLRTIPAPEASCRVAEWAEWGSKDGVTLEQFGGEPTTTAYTAMPDYHWDVQAAGLDSDNYLFPTETATVIGQGVDTFCQANIKTPTTVRSYGTLNLQTPVWSKVAENTTQFGADFTHITYGMTAPAHNFIYLSEDANAADMLIENVRLDPIFFAAHAEVEGGTPGDIHAYIEAFGLGSYLGAPAMENLTPSTDTYRALNAYASEIFYDYYGE